ncbi:hypothetical protein [Lignipirellula cremea]|uniref:hypothetical protein n=1 Tax=Lignipirellula cremea TaxID=2528010 RepID=UPI0011A34122|nr:hypothetical protein [Lignipirellula cremea]
MPEMFGDYRRAGPTLVITPASGLLPALATEIPVGAAISGLRAAENNHALPADRVWASFNYFSNAYDVQTDGSFGLTPTSRSQSLYRSVIAVEKLLDCGQTSLEVRMPFGSALNTTGVAGAGANVAGFGVESNSLGNLNLLLKRLMYADECRAFSVGVGLELPTGSSGAITYGALHATVDSQAVHVVPYAAYTERSGRWFGHAFAQLDIAAGSDPFQATLNGATPELAGKIDQPVLLGMDAGLGYWLLQPCCPQGRGLALLSEIHSTLPIHDDDDDFVAAGALGTFAINSPPPAYEVLHLTAGIHAELGQGWSLRSGVVFPMRKERVFDAEYVLQINRTR